MEYFKHFPEYNLHMKKGSKNVLLNFWLFLKSSLCESNYHNPSGVAFRARLPVQMKQLQSL